MKNPCNECLVRAICIDPTCKILNEFVRKMIKDHKGLSISKVTRIWLEKYELRSRIIYRSRKQNGI